jgi:predicted peroxiredoxin
MPFGLFARPAGSPARRLARLAGCALAILAAGLLVRAPATAEAQEAPPRLVTVVTSADPQTQLMAFVLTVQAIDQGAEAHVLLCGPGGDLGLADPPESATAPQEPQGMSPQALMQRLMQGGVTVEVCALYLPNAGIGEDALLDGVSPAAPPAMAARLLEDNVRLLTF